jgi:pSer/pThr/pTyr-binding forkhead associated (FHA) protein
MARLIVGSGGESRTVELAPGKALSVGRDPTNDIPLPEERGSSRRHCEVRPAAGGGWEVIDLGATNKTRVNGSAVDRRALATGDVIEVGKVTLKFEDPDEEARLSQAGKQGVCLLEYADGPRKGQRVLLSSARTTLGRRPGNTIILEDRMASGHHAEVVKDLNGYTIRDLGSTNGIMVNGQPTTEAPLAHGTRLRVGGTRFVFRDPSMKEIEVELSKMEDEDGWGMMGDIDLSRARVSKAGTLSTVAFLGLVAAGGFFLMKESDKPGTGGGQEPTGEQIANGSFERAELPWTWADGGSLNVVRALGPQGGSLEAKNDAAEGARVEDVVYDEEIPASRGRTVRIKAKVRGQGELLAVWRNDGDRASGATPATFTEVLTGQGGGTLDRTLAFPSWAAALSLKLRVPVGGRVTLDDLSVRATADRPPTETCDCPGLPAATIEADGRAAIRTSLTPLAVSITATAMKGTERLVFQASEPPVKDDLTVRVSGKFLGGEQELAGKVAWTPVEEGLQAEIECPGADKVGLEADLPRAHVGGSLNVLTANDARSVALAVGPVEGEVRKTLVGNPKGEGARPATLLAFQPIDVGAALSVADAGDAIMTRLVHALPGAKGRLVIVTDFSAQAQAAKKALEEAKLLARTSPGAAIGALRQVAQANPFEAGVAEEASTLARQLEEKANQEIQALRDAVAGFRVLGSPAALAEMRKRAATLRASFPPASATPDEGSFDGRVARLAAEAEALERTSALATLGPRTARLERLAETLAATRGYEAMAVLIYRDLAARLGPLVSGTPAGDELLKRYEEGASTLEQKPGVQEALPPR